MSTSNAAQKSTDLFVAMARSLERHEEIHWLQVAWEGEGQDRRAVQFRGFAHGVPVSSITWVHKYHNQEAGYLAVLSGSLRKPLGIFPTLAKAQNEVGFELGDITEALEGLFAAMADFSRAFHAYWEPCIKGLVLGFDALLAFAAYGYHQHLWSCARAIRSSSAAILVFNAKWSSRWRQLVRQRVQQLAAGVHF